MYRQQVIFSNSRSQTLNIPRTVLEIDQFAGSDVSLRLARAFETRSRGWTQPVDKYTTEPPQPAPHSRLPQRLSESSPTIQGGVRIGPGLSFSSACKMYCFVPNSRGNKAAANLRPASHTTDAYTV